MADISKIKLPDETEVNLKDAQAFANIENDGQGGSSYTITRRDGTTKQVTIPNVTTTDPGLMTASDKTKIDTIEQGAEVNQQAFSKIRVTKGSAHTDLDADTKTDTLELIEGDNITLTPSAVSDAVTIHAKDTVYTLAQDTTDGHIIILTNNDEGSTDHVQTITIPDNNTTYTVSLNESTNEIVLTDSLGNTMTAKPSNASTSLDGFMSKNDKSKLDGIASGAEVNQNAFSNVVVDDVTIAADSKTDTLTFIAGTNISITPNATNDSITISSSYTNTTYELTQDATDGHKFTLSGSNGYTKTITIPDNNTTYTLSVGTGADANQIVFTPSSGSATKITVPYATKALQDADGDVIKDTYAASFSIVDHTITLKNKSGVSLGTVTVPDNNTTYTFAEGTTNKAFSVTPSGGSAQTVPIHGLGSASEKNFTTSVTSGSADLVTSGAVASAISTAIDNLPEPMIFKGTLGTNGTITSLPTAASSNEGWTYKVITDGTYASQAAKVGDMFVSAKIDSAYQWVYVPSGDDVEDTWRNIKVNGTEKLGTGISSGAVDFVDGDFINITYANNKITVSHADTSSQASVSNSSRTYIQSVTLDGAGHVTKLTSATETVVNTDRYVNSASFADDTTASANSPVKMTLTRAGSDTSTVIANIPKVSASSAGVAPKGASVSSQSQSTKFLREDGTWSAPSYTVNTDTKVTSVGNHYSPTADSSAQLSASASGGTAAWSIDVVQGIQLQRDAKGHVVGVTVTSGKIPGNPNTNYYHKTGTWSGLTYTAGKVGSPDDLAFTIPTGTSATTVAVGNHTHSTTIATSTGTNQLTLSHGGKYVITTGGTSFVFTMPTDNNTDTNVTQTATNTNANYEVLFSGTADNTTRTEGARKYSNLIFNPSTGTLTTTKVVASTSTLGVADIDTANITEDNVGNLIVTGAARFLNTINGSISGNAATASDSAKLNGYASDTSATNNTIARRTANGYIFATYFNQSSGAETPTSNSYMIYANGDGYFRKSTVANMKTAMSLNNVENKSSATIRGEITSANVTTALGYTPPTTNTTYSLSASGESIILTGSDGSTSTHDLSDEFAKYTPYKGNLSTIIGQGSPATEMKTYWESNTNVPINSVNTAYNTNGKEYTFILSKGGSASYGSILKYGYGDLYMWILRRYNNAWQSTDWEKISAGYADSAGTATSATKATQDSDGNTINSTYLKLSGGTLTGRLNLSGADICLRTASTSSDDSGDIYWTYGNGAEKMRFYAPNTPTAKFAPFFREFKSDGTSLYNGNLVLGDGTGASGTWEISINGRADRLLEMSTNIGAYVTNDTHILQLGYFDATSMYDNCTLYITSEFWGNQHGSADIINYQQSTNTNTTPTIQPTLTRVHIGGKTVRTFYYKNDSENFRVYLYAYVSGGNQYGRWNISVVQSSNSETTIYNLWHRELLANQANENLTEIPHTEWKGNAISATTATTAGTANSVAWGNVTGKPDTYTPSAHNHGTLHSDFTVTLANQTTDEGWKMINSSYKGFLLKSIRTQASAPDWILGNYGAGICFGGSDTKGIVSVAYHTPSIKIAGGNGVKPVWWIGLTGTSGASYNLANFLTTAGGTLTGNLSVTNVLGISQTSGTAGGISLYNGAGYVDEYGIAFRKTSDRGKHGYVQGDWATSFTMSNTANRGWIFRRYNSGNVASISCEGHAVFNGSVTIGGNEANTSGARMVYNSNTSSIDFVFVA